MAKLMTEQEITLKPIRRAAANTGRMLTALGAGMGRTIIALGKGTVKGLNHLGEMGQKPQTPVHEAPIDLGFGKPKSKVDLKTRIAAAKANRLRNSNTPIHTTRPVRRHSTTVYNPIGKQENRYLRQLLRDRKRYQ